MAAAEHGTKAGGDGAAVRYRPARANLSTAVPYDHLHRAARRAELAEAGLAAAAALAYEWDLETGRMVWSPGWQCVAGADAVSPPPSATAFETLMAAADRSRRYEAMFGTGETDEGEGVAFRLTYRLASGGRIEEEGRWFTDDEGRPKTVRGS